MIEEKKTEETVTMDPKTQALMGLLGAVLCTPDRAQREVLGDLLGGAFLRVDAGLPLVADRDEDPA